MIPNADTVVVPSHEDGFQKVFLGQNQWYALTINEKKLPIVRYLAIYRTKPISAITHVATVEKIVPHPKLYHKYIVYFKQNSVEKLPNYIKMKKTHGLMNPIFTSHDRLFSCSFIEDLTKE